MTNSKETRTYLREGRHSREDAIVVDSHVIIFAKSGFRVEGLEYLANEHRGVFPVTVVRTNCPNAHGALERKGYRRAERYSRQTSFPYHENEF